MYRSRDITRNEAKRRNFNRLRVVFTFPDEDVMRDFMAYMSNGGGEYPFVEDNGGRFTYQRDYDPDGGQSLYVDYFKDEESTEDRT